ncbi:hypothetical protein KI688_004968 [Linnemannia hyalina]|uniref:Uncharacterized protein n=1 Tax=Linnemannia hyalina TaxID=64524 RepID=A0A9P8BND6_9FUNG|nr:hypothetical protein KI688_004968 [Linnemannia hyalina]
MQGGRGNPRATTTAHIPASSRALNIPEILMAIGECFYLSSDGQAAKRAANRDKIISLIAFIQVSKLWFRTFHPILWHSYNPSTSTASLNIQSQSRLRTYGSFTSLTNCQSNSAVLSWSSWNSSSLRLHHVDDQHRTSEPARCLRKYCPNFKELTIHYVHSHIDTDSATIAPPIAFIRDCSASGLNKLIAWDAPWHDNELLSAIISHGTLVDLKVSWAVDDSIDLQDSVYPSAPYAVSPT